MKVCRKSLLMVFILACFLFTPCYAYEGSGEYNFEGKGFEQILAEFMEQNGLNENNFSFGWYDTRDGQLQFYNGDLYMKAASMYKLPLCMEYQTRLSDGRLSPDDTIMGLKIGDAMNMSIVYSNNEISVALRDALGVDHATYRLMLASYSCIPAEELPGSFFTDNYMSPRLIMGILMTLHEESELYAPVIELMKQGTPDMFFRKYQEEYEIAHKYGSFEGMLNDCGIVYTPNPFMLVAFTKHVPNANHVLGGICDLFTQYSLYVDEQETIAAAEEARLEEERREAEEAKADDLKAASYEIEQPEAEKPEAERTETESLPETEGNEARQRIFVCGAVALFLGGSAAVCVFRRKKRKS